MRFWREVKRKKERNKKTNIIDGKTDNRIINIFTQKFLVTQQETTNETEFMTELKRT